MNSEQALVDSFRRIELKHAGLLGTPGADASQSRERIVARLRKLADAGDVQEFQCTVKGTWESFLLHSILKRYGIQPYRYRKQRQTTILVRVSKRFMDETLWPIYAAASESLVARFNEIARAILPEIAPPPFSMPILSHDHSADGLCDECRQRMRDEGNSIDSQQVSQ
jgi:hypothetical protein